MNFRILGPLEVDEDSRAVDLGGARQRALLVILLLRRNEVVPTERLLEDLYGTEQPATASKSLQAHISRLRKALGANSLHTRGTGYVLEVGADDVDADRFARELDSGRAALAGGDAVSAERHFEEALALWRGAPLADVAYEDFAQSEIARLQELRLACVEEQCDVRLALGRHTELIGELERLVAEHPLRERLQAQLMLSLYRCGRHADALAAYRKARLELIEELGLEPSRALQDLERAILSQDPALDPPQSAAAPTNETPGRRAAGVLVGRERELEELHAALDDARAGSGRLVLLSGEPGIGKSRLADEFTARARRVGTRVLWGRCWEAGGAPAYWPWVQALRSYLREADPDRLRQELGPGASDVAHLLPELRDLLPDLPQPHDLESEGARFRLFDSTAAFIRRMSQEQPLLLVLDDLHVADVSSLLLLQFVAAELGDARTAVVAIYRDVDIAPGNPIASAMADVTRQASVQIALRGLSESDVVAYIESAAGVEPARDVAAAVYHETEGNPLFVGEVVRLLAAEGRLATGMDSTWRLTLPQGVRQVIGRRLRHLSDPCVETLTLASVLGREFSLAALERLDGRPARELLDILDEAIAARILTDTPGTPGRLRFAHALIRDSLYEDVSPGQRVQLHLRASDALERLYGSDESHLSELAHHLFLALPGGDIGKAIDVARRAGARARELLAYEEAARLYQTALLALELRGDGEPALERRLLLSLGDARARGGNAPDAKDAFLRAAALARTEDAAEDLAVAALGYGGLIVWSRAGSDRVTIHLLEEALGLLGHADTPLRARLLARLAGALRDEIDPARRVSIGEEAVATARRSGDLGALSYALAGLCAAQHGCEDSDRQLAVAAELGRIALDLEDKEREVDAVNAELLVHFDRGAMTEVRERSAAQSRLASQLRQPTQQFFAVSVEAMIALHEGRFSDAERLIPQVLDIGLRAQPRDAEVVHAVQLYELRREQGREAETYDILSRAAGDAPGRPVLRCTLARLAADMGRSAEARRLFEELASSEFAVVPHDNEWLLAGSFLADTARALADTTRAAVLYDQLAPSADKIAADVAEGSAGSVARPLGLLAAMLGRETEAIAHLEQAIEVNRSTDGWPWVAHTQFDLGELLLRLGDEPRATSYLDESRALARELGMTALEQKIERFRS